MLLIEHFDLLDFGKTFFSFRKKEASFLKLMRVSIQLIISIRSTFEKTRLYFLLFYIQYISLYSSTMKILYDKSFFKNLNRFSIYSNRNDLTDISICWTFKKCFTSEYKRKILRISIYSIFTRLVKNPLNLVDLWKISFELQ